MTRPQSNDHGEEFPGGAAGDGTADTASGGAPDDADGEQDAD